MMSYIHFRHVQLNLVQLNFIFRAPIVVQMVSRHLTEPTCLNPTASPKVTVAKEPSSYGRTYLSLASQVEMDRRAHFPIFIGKWEKNSVYWERSTSSLSLYSSITAGMELRNITVEVSCAPYMWTPAETLGVTRVNPKYKLCQKKDLSLALNIGNGWLRS